MLRTVSSMHGECCCCQVMGASKSVTQYVNLAAWIQYCASFNRCCISTLDFLLVLDKYHVIFWG